jgi:hypothetical protein
LFEKWSIQGIEFYVLHLSDEFDDDDISFYELPQCLGVVRIYQRADIPASVKSKVLVIPLGYHWTLAGGSEDPVNKTPRLPFRNVVWSFYGTNWQDRQKKLEPLQQIQPHSLRLVDSWDSPEKLTRNQYVASLLDSLFVPCPSGNNSETFRLYEALECGCIPLYVKTPGDETYIGWIQEEIGLLSISRWSETCVLMQHFLNEKEVMESYRNMLLNRWRIWKERLGTQVRKTWDL